MRCQRCGAWQRTEYELTDLCHQCGFPLDDRDGLGGMPRHQRSEIVLAECDGKAAERNAERMRFLRGVETIVAGVLN